MIPAKFTNSSTHTGTSCRKNWILKELVLEWILGRFCVIRWNGHNN